LQAGESTEAWKGSEQQQRQCVIADRQQMYVQQSTLQHVESTWGSFCVFALP
jgi:carboxylesterase type B